MNFAWSDDNNQDSTASCLDDDGVQHCVGWHRHLTGMFVCLVLAKKKKSSSVWSSQRKKTDAARYARKYVVKILVLISLFLGPLNSVALCIIYGLYSFIFEMFYFFFVDPVFCFFLFFLVDEAFLSSFIILCQCGPA